MKSRCGTRAIALLVDVDGIRLIIRTSAYLTSYRSWRAHFLQLTDRRRRRRRFSLSRQDASGGTSWLYRWCNGGKNGGHQSFLFSLAHSLPNSTMCIIRVHVKQLVTKIVMSDDFIGAFFFWPTFPFRRRHRHVRNKRTGSWAIASRVVAAG